MNGIPSHRRETWIAIRSKSSNITGGSRKMPSHKGKINEKQYRQWNIGPEIPRLKGHRERKRRFRSREPIKRRHRWRNSVIIRPVVRRTSWEAYQELLWRTGLIRSPIICLLSTGVRQILPDIHGRWHKKEYRVLGKSICSFLWQFWL